MRARNRRMRRARWHRRCFLRPFPWADVSVLVHSYNVVIKRRYLPHASEKLDETTIAECKSNDNVGRADSLGVHIDQREHKCGQGESRETERSWVGELAVRGPVETGLEFTTEGSKAEIWVVGCNVCKRVAAVVIWCPLLWDGTIVGMIESCGAMAFLVKAGSTL
jgi:hypothetical protein